MRRYLHAFALVASLVIGPRAAAYEIGSESDFKKAFDLHETMTTLAFACEKDAGSEIDCRSFLGRIAADAAYRKAAASNDIRYSVRWPDDPTRMLDRDPSKIRFGAKLKLDCATALGRGVSVDRQGLLCASHFGPLQFMHAQATPGDRGDPQTTRAKILAWADFAFAAATRLEFRDMVYCDAVEKETGTASLREALALSRPSWCTRRGRFLPFLRPYEAWTVRTFFALDCVNPFQEHRCWERTGPAGEAAAIAAAKGALLHLVQDSYSQSHVARPAGEGRPGPRGPYQALIVCRPPVFFYEYGEQNIPGPGDDGAIIPDPHSVADQKPGVDPSCSDRRNPVHDVITASAHVLRFLENKDAAGFATYLATHVFPG